jgi:hypothetical protein
VYDYKGADYVNFYDVDERRHNLVFMTDSSPRMDENLAYCPGERERERALLQNGILCSKISTEKLKE